MSCAQKGIQYPLMMKNEYTLSDFDFELPSELIAQSPLKERDNSRLMLLRREVEKITHKKFKDIVDFLQPGDVLVRNVTKVIPARLFANKESGAKIELLLTKFIKTNDKSHIFEIIAKPGRRLRVGDVLHFNDSKYGTRAKIISKSDFIITAEFISGDFFSYLNEYGQTPLPKYIREKIGDSSRYQTVYAKKGYSAAAPTAGLHFTKELLGLIAQKGVIFADLELEVGLGTFAPIRTENINEHKMHSENFKIPRKSAEIVNTARKEGRRIIAVGTTSLRALESAVSNNQLLAGEYSTDIFIKPGFEFKVTDALITNFHLPKSTLLMLVSAFAGKDFIMRAYKEAVDKNYRFFSFGDAMFIF